MWGYVRFFPFIHPFIHFEKAKTVCSVCSLLVKRGNSLVSKTSWYGGICNGNLCEEYLYRCSDHFQSRDRKIERVVRMCMCTRYHLTCCKCRKL